MRRTVLAIAILGLLLAPPVTAAPAIQGTLYGQGTAATFTIFAQGLALEGGAFEWTLVCGECLARFGLVDTSLTLVQNGESRTLAPGLYELREFRGLIAHSKSDTGYFVLLQGMGDVVRIEP